MQMTSPDTLLVSLFETFMDWHVKEVEFSTPDEADKYGMAFTFDLDCSNYGYEQDGNTHHPEWERRYRAFIHVIILRPRKCFVAVSDESSLSDVPLSAWINTSNHDTCWRSDGLRVFHSEMMKAWHHCYDHVPEQHQRPPVAANISCELTRVFGKPIQFVKVEDINDDRERNSGYWRKITSITPIKHVLKL